MILPLRLTVEEFALLVRLHPEVVRRKIRGNVIRAQGRPHMIPRAELTAFQVNFQEAAEYLVAVQNTPAPAAA